MNHKFIYKTTEYNPSLLAGDYVSERIKTDNTFYEIEQLEYQKELLKDKQGIILDIGAHLGTHSLFYASQMNSTRVISFEPSIILFEILKSTVHNNKPLSNIIEIKNVGLWDFITKKDLYSHYENNSGSNSVFKQTDDAQVVEVIELTTLDYYFNRNKLNINEEIIFIKLDIEGAEANAILGSLRTIERYKPLIYCECHEEKHAIRIMSILSRFNYRILSINNEHYYFST